MGNYRKRSIACSQLKKDLTCGKVGKQPHLDKINILGQGLSPCPLGGTHD